jgi:hypothetical protein
VRAALGLEQRPADFAAWGGPEPEDLAEMAEMAEPDAEHEDLAELMAEAPEPAAA